MWNGLPNDVVAADTINTFKNRLDKYWSNQDVLFNFNTDLTRMEVCQFVCEIAVKMRAKRTTSACRNILELIVI